MIFRFILKIAKKIGEFNSRVLLSIVYILGVGATALFAKLVRKHFLDLKIISETDSYWIERKSANQGLEEFKRSF